VDFGLGISFTLSEHPRADPLPDLGSPQGPLRVWRAHRGLSLCALAATAGISAAMLSEMETGKKEGSVRTLLVLARVLDVDTDDLVPWRD